MPFRLLVLLLLAALFYAAFLNPGPSLAENPETPPTTLEEPVLRIPAVSGLDQLARDMNFLAADALEGRDTGSPGMYEAAEHIRKRFYEAGLVAPKKLPDSFQTFQLPSPPELGDDNSLATVLPQGKQTWKLEEDYIPCSFGGEGAFSGPVVFCGYGIADPEQNYDEFAGVDLKGKVALILRRVPGQTRPGSLYVGENGQIDTNVAALRTKMTNARKNGAAAVLFVNDLFSTREGKDELIAFGYGGSGGRDEVPAAHITQKAANQLLQQGLGLSLQEIDRSIESSMQPASAELNELTIEGKFDLQFSRTEGVNVIATLEPEDPENAETIVIGAHYDHVGWGKYGSLARGTEAIHNGADDNASGTAALMALADRIGKFKGQLKHRVVLIAFAGEERGLLGSKHYVESPVYPLAETRAMLNLDMVGRMSDEKLTVFGVGSSSVWKEWLDELERETELNFFREAKALGPSDHAPFYEKKIPVLHLFTGLHEDYHRPTDDIDEINIIGINRVVDVLEGITLALADSDARPDYIENKEWIQVGRHAGGRPFVGISPELDFEENGFKLKAVTQNSPADHAGLEAGDVIVGVNGRGVNLRADFWAVVDLLKPRDTLQLQFIRDKQKLSSELKLDPPR